MFENMKLYAFISLFFSLLCLGSGAQNNPCPTQFTPAQTAQLKAFQQQLEQGTVSLQKKAIQYVPLKAHIIGNQKGFGYYPISSLLSTICELNERFAPVGFYFYLADTLDYINDDALYIGSSDAIWTSASDYKMNGAVNVFFHGVTTEGWCGVYFGGIDVVFIMNSCQGPNATTLTHELGHFFGLPHTFYGWEGGNTPGEIEKIDKSNCRSAGDGFCDTKPDYVSNRWGCPYSVMLRDPNGVNFKPDSSIYMSYSMDHCQSRFSEEQIQEMQYNLNSRQISKSTCDTRLLPAPLKVSPLEGDTGLNPVGVPLKWNAVPGAFAYHVQVARFGDWNYINYERLVQDTQVTATVFGTWQYAWRVKAITAGKTCGSFGSTDTFYTRELPMGVVQLQKGIESLLYPNPVYTGNKVMLRLEPKQELKVFDEKGAELQLPYANESGLQNDSYRELVFEQAGIYILVIKSTSALEVKRLVVLQNP